MVVKIISPKLNEDRQQQQQQQSCVAVVQSAEDIVRKEERGQSIDELFTTVCFIIVIDLCLMHKGMILLFSFELRPPPTSSLLFQTRRPFCDITLTLFITRRCRSRCPQLYAASVLSSLLYVYFRRSFKARKYTQAHECICICASMLWKI